MNIKNHKIVAIAAGWAITLATPVFAQQQNPNEKKGGNKPAGAHQVAHQNAPQHQASHPQQISHQNAPQHHAVVQQQTMPRQQNARSGGSGGGNHNHKNQSQITSSGQLSRGSARSLNQSGSAPVSVQSVQSGNASRYNQRNQAQASSYQQGSYASGGKASQGSPSYNNGGGHQGSQYQVTPNNQYNSGNSYGGLWFSGNTHGDWNHDGEHYWNNHNYRWYDGGWLIIDAGFNPYYVNQGYSSTTPT